MRLPNHTSTSHQSLEQTLKVLGQKLTVLADSQQKTDEQQKKTDEQLKKTDEKLERIGITLGGVTNNLGDVAEDYFYDGLNEVKELGGIHFDEVKARIKGWYGEYDIVLRNDKTVGVVEVKHKVHPDDIKQFAQKTLPSFKKDFPKFQDYQLVGGVAGFSIPKNAIEQAKNLGLFVLTQSGKTMKVIVPPKTRKY